MLHVLILLDLCSILRGFVKVLRWRTHCLRNPRHLLNRVLHQIVYAVVDLFVFTIWLVYLLRLIPYCLLLALIGFI